MVTEDYVSFETAKLLKEKGFDGVCRTAYETITNKHEVEQCSHFSWGKLNQVKRPTLQMAMKWLREVHNCLISIGIYSITPKVIWCYKYHDTKKGYYRIHSQYETYEKACEAAIKYCLENLI